MSRNRLMIVTLVMLLVATVASALPATAAYPGGNTPYPPHSVTGSIGGVVFTHVTSDRVPNVYVAIVNAANTSMIYDVTTAKDDGSYRIYGVAAVSGGAYKIIARAEGYEMGVSAATGCDGGLDFMNVEMLPKATATPAPQAAQKSGSVTGRITESGTNAAIPGATVSMVSSTNSDNVYFTTTTDKNGVFRFDDLNDFNTAYQLKVTATGYQDGYSILFSAEPGTAVDLNVNMVHRAAEITPFADSTRAPNPTEEQTAGAAGSPGFELPVALAALVIGIVAVVRKLK